MKKQTAMLGLFVCLIVMTFSSPLMAVMPTAVDSGASGAATSGNFLTLLTGYLDKGIDPLAWGSVIMTFIIVAVAVINKFNDARRNARPPIGQGGLPGNKTEWSEVWLTAVVGAVVILFVVFIVTEGTQVI